MTIPSNLPPNTPPSNPSAPPTQGSEAPPSHLSMSEVDPAGVWSKFLGPTATPEDVQKFIQGLLKAINAQLQHQAQRAKEASDKLKRSIEGGED